MNEKNEKSPFYGLLLIIVGFIFLITFIYSLFNIDSGIEAKAKVTYASAIKKIDGEDTQEIKVKYDTDYKTYETKITGITKNFYTEDEDVTIYVDEADPTIISIGKKLPSFKSLICAVVFGGIGIALFLGIFSLPKISLPNIKIPNIGKKE